MGPADGWLLTVDFVRPIPGVEQIRELAHGFGRTKNQETGIVQGVVKERQDLFLQWRRHVDEHIAATDEIDARERRVRGNVLTCEDANITNRLVDPVDMILFVKEASQPFRGNLGFDTFRIRARARTVERRLIAEIGREDLDRRMDGSIIEEFEKRHAQRI